MNEWLMEDEFSFSTAINKRKCYSCSNEIPKGSKHSTRLLADKWGVKKKNLCKKCMLLLIDVRIHKLMQLEKKVKTEL